MARGTQTRGAAPEAGSLDGCSKVVVLGAIDLPPLCLGPDNGDGRNSLAMCLLLTAIWPAFMSVFVIPLAYVAAAALRRVGP